jgi:uncharacterized membrane protein (DUF485 family)
VPEASHGARRLRSLTADTATIEDKARQTVERRCLRERKRKMQTDLVGRIRQNPKYAELVEKRSRFSKTLAIIMLVIYFGFIFLVAFLRGVMGINVGGVVTLAFPLGLAVMVSAVAVTGIYVVRANGEFDRLTREIVEETR